jgi:hypothetical protein
MAEARTRCPPRGPAGAGGRFSGCGELERIASVSASGFDVPVTNDTRLAGNLIERRIRS